MMKLALQVFESPNGIKLADWSNATDLNISTNEHGFLGLSFNLQTTQHQSFVYYDTFKGKHVSLNYGAGNVWEGRIEDVDIEGYGVSVNALGYWRAFSDVPYNALWSTSSTADWEPITTELNSAYSPARYEMDNNNRLFMAPRAGDTFGSSHRPDFAGFYYRIPDKSTRDITVIQFDYEIQAPSTWRIQLGSRQEDFTGFTNLWNHIPNGTLETGSHFITLTGRPILTFLMFLNAASGTISGDTGDVYARITNIRIATTITNRVNTTATAIIAAGSAIITPASMDNIHVGQRLVISPGTSSSESVEVTEITTSTFTATFAKVHSGTWGISSIAVYADEIVKDIVSEVRTVNPNQLSAKTDLINSPGLDLNEAAYQDIYPANILNSLVDLGDDNDPPKRWEVGIWEDQKLHFRERGATGRKWSVMSSQLTIKGTINDLFNSVYGVYKEPSGHSLRTDANTDSKSVTKHGLTRQAVVKARTSSKAEVKIHRDARLNDRKDPTPQGEITLEYLTDEQGRISPKWLLRSGDTITLRTLPVVLSPTIDKVRTFVVAGTNYNVEQDEVTPIAERPIPSLEQLVNRRREGL